MQLLWCNCCHASAASCCLPIQTAKIHMMQFCPNTWSVPPDNLLWFDLAWPRTQQSKPSTQILHTWFCILSGFSSAVLCPYVLIHLTGKLLSNVLSCISSGILSANLCGISSGILYGISSGISSGTLSGISCSIWHILSDIFYLLQFLLDILSGISSGILSGKSSVILSDILSGILSGIPSGILSGISHGILSGMSSGILSGISSSILSGILFGKSGKSAGILSGRWGLAVHTELGRSPVEVQRCTLRWAAPRLRSSGAHWARQLAGWGPAVTLSWEGPRLRSSGAHWAGQVPGWGPAVYTELGKSQVEVQQCTLSWEGPRLRSSSAHWARKLAKRLAKSWQGGSRGGS